MASAGRVCPPLPYSCCPRSWGAVRYVMTIPGKAGEDLLLVTSEACVLLDGQDLAPRWTLGAAQIHRYAVLPGGSPRDEAHVLLPPATAHPLVPPCTGRTPVWAALACAGGAASPSRGPA